MTFEGSRRTLQAERIACARTRYQRNMRQVADRARRPVLRSRVSEGYCGGGEGREGSRHPVLLGLVSQGEDFAFYLQ